MLAWGSYCRGRFSESGSAYSKSYFNEQFREVGVMQVVIEYAPVWHATDTLIGLRSARNALANRDLALRVITKTYSLRPGAVKEMHRSYKKSDYVA